MMMRTGLLAFAALWLGMGLCLAQEPLDIPNLDFSKGQEGWTAWTGDTAHPWRVLPTGGPGGKAMLQIEAGNRAHEVMVMTATDKLPAGQRYLVTIWWQFENLSPDAQVDFRTIFRDADGKWLSGDDHSPRSSEERDGWTVKRYRISVPAKTTSATLGFWVRETVGTMRVSNISVEPAAAQQRTFDSMYQYDPEQVPLGMAPLSSFYKLRETQSPFIPRARRWNELMVRAGFVQEDLSRARRLAGYARAQASALAPHEQGVAKVLADLDALQQTYGRLYDAGKADQLAAQFDPAAEALQQSLAGAEVGLKRFMAGLKSAAVSDAWTKLPQVDRTQPWWDAKTGRPRYLHWSRWSDANFWEMEQPLNMGEGHTLTAGMPSAFKDGVASWDSYMTEWERKRSAGATESSLITHYSLHDKGYLASEFAKQHNDDPDLRMWDAEGQPIGPPAGLAMLNWLNPLARGHMVDVLTQMAQFFKDKREFQYYVTSWESAGPRAGDVRIGTNPTHVISFREYLKQRYGTIAELNRRWGSNYAAFEDLQPAPEATTAPGDPSTPLEIESQRWAQEVYVDYITLITKTLNAVDPTKPVLGEQSGLLSRILSPRIMQSVNIIGHHNRARTTMPVQMWISSLQRYDPTPSALFENFWGCQEDHPQRLMDERAMRAQMRRYLYRHAVWGRCAQVWWYAYTSAPYLLAYNGNWFTPVYDLTTMRYSAAGFPVERAKVDRVEGALLQSTIVPSRIALVQPYATMLAQGRSSDTLREWLAWHGILYPRNLLYEAVPDAYFVGGRAKLSSFEVVILPFATHLDEGFSKQLIAFAQGGGTIIASGPAGLYNELGRDNGALLKAAGLQAKRETEQGDWRYDYGASDKSQAKFIEVVVGKGRLVALKESAAGLKTEGEALAALIRQRTTPVAEAPGTTLELLARQLPDGRVLLCALNADPDQAATGEVFVQGSFTRVADIDLPTAARVPASVKAGRTSFRVSLDAGTTAYFVLAK
jgi:hypothetical protein